MNVENGTRIADQGDLTGALPWFAEALQLDREDPAAAATHRLRLGTLMNQCPILDAIFGHDKTILSATLDQAGRRLATGSADHTARIWDVATGNPVSPPLSHDGPVNWVEFRSDGTVLLTASSDGTIRIWAAADGRPSAGRWLTHGSPVRVARFSPDGRRVVSAGFDGTVWLWNADTGAALGVPQKLPTELFCLAFSPDGQKVAIGAGDGNASIWQLGEEGLRLRGKWAHRSTVRDVAFSPDGKRLLTASHDGTARVWDVETKAPITPELKHCALGIPRRIQSRWNSCGDCQSRRDCASGTRRPGRPITPAAGPMRHSIAVRDACFSPDGGRVATAGLRRHRARLGRVFRRTAIAAAFSRRRVATRAVHARRVARPDNQLRLDRADLERGASRQLSRDGRARRGRQPRRVRSQRKTFRDSLR